MQDMIMTDLCRAKADQCGRLADEAQSRERKVTLSNMERTWLKLADQCDRLESLIKSTTS
jgi:hypothetical protein